jgi:UDP-2-acetamido-3-amino-2,3-dideoxy-glucuronate N-acetyltransferase
MKSMYHQESKEPFIFKSKTILSEVGNLNIVNDFEDSLGFIPNRFFLISKVSKGQIRGSHAHWRCYQAIVPINGSVLITWISAGGLQGSYKLIDPDCCLVIPPLNWITLSDFSGEDLSVLVLASHSYEERDYIRDYELFLSLRP